MNRLFLAIGVTLVAFAHTPVGVCDAQEAPATPPASAAPPASGAPSTASVPLAPSPPTVPPAASSSAAPPPTVGGPPVYGSIGKRYTSWDVNIDAAYGRIFSDPAKADGFFRARAGVLWIRDPIFYSLGLTYEWSPLSAATLGIQGELLNLEVGVWGQIGALFDVAHGAKPGGMLALGFSLFGAELQLRDYDGLGFAPALYAKIRIPLGIIGFGLRGR